MEEIKPTPPPTLDYTNRLNRIHRKPLIINAIGIIGLILGILGVLGNIVTLYSGYILFINIGPASDKALVVQDSAPTDFHVEPYMGDNFGPQGLPYAARMMIQSKIRQELKFAASTPHNEVLYRILTDAGAVAFPSAEAEIGKIGTSEDGFFYEITTPTAILKFNNLRAEVRELSSGKIWKIDDWIFTDPDGGRHIASSRINDLVLDGMDDNSVESYWTGNAMVAITPNSLGTAIRLLKEAKPDNIKTISDIRMNWTISPNILQIGSQSYSIKPDGQLVEAAKVIEPAKQSKIIGSKLAVFFGLLVTGMACILSGIQIYASIELLADTRESIRKMNILCAWKLLYLFLDIIATIWFFYSLESAFGEVISLTSFLPKSGINIGPFVFFTIVEYVIAFALVAICVSLLKSTGVINHAHFHGYPAALFTPKTLEDFLSNLAKSFQSKSAVRRFQILLVIITCTGLVLLIQQLLAITPDNRPRAAFSIIYICFIYLIVLAALNYFWRTIRANRVLQLILIPIFVGSVVSFSIADNPNISDLLAKLRSNAPETSLNDVYFKLSNYRIEEIIGQVETLFDDRNFQVSQRASHVIESNGYLGRGLPDGLAEHHKQVVPHLIHWIKNRKDCRDKNSEIFNLAMRFGLNVAETKEIIQNPSPPMDSSEIGRLLENVKGSDEEVAPFLLSFVASNIKYLPNNTAQLMINRSDYIRNELIKNTPSYPADQQAKIIEFLIQNNSTVKFNGDQWNQYLTELNTPTSQAAYALVFKQAILRDANRFLPLYVKSNLTALDENTYGTYGPSDIVKQMKRQDLYDLLPQANAPTKRYLIYLIGQSQDPKDVLNLIDLMNTDDPATQKLVANQLIPMLRYQGRVDSQTKQLIRARLKPWTERSGKVLLQMVNSAPIPTAPIVPPDDSDEQSTPGVVFPLLFGCLLIIFSYPAATLILQVLTDPNEFNEPPGSNMTKIHPISREQP